MNRSPRPTNPLGPVLLALIAILLFGAAYGLFGIGKDALGFAGAALAIYSIPVVVIFGIAGIVIGVRRLFRRKPPLDNEPEEPRWPPQLS
jgi:hypothetical protein